MMTGVLVLHILLISVLTSVKAGDDQNPCEAVGMTLTHDDNYQLTSKINYTIMVRDPARCNKTRPTCSPYNVLQIKRNEEAWDWVLTDHQSPRSVAFRGTICDIEGGKLRLRCGDNVESSNTLEVMGTSQLKKNITVSEDCTFQNNSVLKVCFKSHPAVLKWHVKLKLINPNMSCEEDTGKCEVFKDYLYNYCTNFCGESDPQNPDVVYVRGNFTEGPRYTLYVLPEVNSGCSLGGPVHISDYNITYVPPSPESQKQNETTGDWVVVVVVVVVMAVLTTATVFGVWCASTRFRPTSNHGPSSRQPSSEPCTPLITRQDEVLLVHACDNDQVKELVADLARKISFRCNREVVDVFGPLSQQQVEAPDSWVTDVMLTRPGVTVVVVLTPPLLAVYNALHRVDGRDLVATPGRQQHPNDTLLHSCLKHVDDPSCHDRLRLVQILSDNNRTTPADLPHLVPHVRYRLPDNLEQLVSSLSPPSVPSVSHVRINRSCETSSLVNHNVKSDSYV